MKSRIAVQAIAMAITAATASILSATSLRPVNLAETVESAHAAFTGTVRSVTRVQTPLGPADEVTVEVSEPIFGEGKTSQTVTWRQLNQVGRVVVAGMPSFTTGTKTMVFLTAPGAGTGLQSPVGFGQGAFRIFRDGRTGAEYARNEFMNANLLRDLNTTAVAARIAQRRLVGRSPSPAAVAAEAKGVQRGLQQRHSGGTSVQSIVEAARLFHQVKQTGQKPSSHFASPPPSPQ